jgi:hypothetical protein
MVFSRNFLLVLWLALVVSSSFSMPCNTVLGGGGDQVVKTLQSFTPDEQAALLSPDSELHRVFESIVEFPISSKDVDGAYALFAGSIARPEILAISPETDLHATAEELGRRIGTLLRQQLLYRSSKKKEFGSNIEYLKLNASHLLSDFDANPRKRMFTKPAPERPVAKWKPLDPAGKLSQIISSTEPDAAKARALRPGRKDEDIDLESVQEFFIFLRDHMPPGQPKRDYFHLGNDDLEFLDHMQALSLRVRARFYILSNASDFYYSAIVHENQNQYESKAKEYRKAHRLFALTLRRFQEILDAKKVPPNVLWRQRLRSHLKDLRKYFQREDPTNWLMDEPTRKLYQELYDSEFKDG